MKGKIFAILVLLAGITCSYAQSTIKGYEYWFNDDFANKTSIAVSSTQYLQINQNIPTTGLENGVNVLNFRSFDDVAKYSSIVSHFFYKISLSESTISPKTVAYEYWLNDDYANTVRVNTPVQKQVAINELISMSALYNGINKFNIRFKDNAGMWSPIVRHFFYKTALPTSIESPKIVAYEYWLNNDYAHVVTVNTPIQQEVAINELISISALYNGINNFNIRFKDNLGKWGPVVSEFFYKIPVPTSIESPKIVAYEYWLNNDYAHVVTVNTPIQQEVALNELISMSALYNGINNFNIRFKDNAGKWGPVVSEFFYKTPVPTSIESPKIIAYEYWLNNDYANAVKVNTPVQQQVTINELISMSTLYNGINNFNIRFKDNAGKWSTVVNDFFYKIPAQVLAQNKITAYRYWIDNDIANAINIPLTPAHQSNIINTINLTQLSKGQHEINIQCKDSLGRWSVVISDTITKVSLPIPNFSYASVITCDSTVVSFTNHSIDADAYYWDFKNGTNDSIANPTQVFYTPGNYQVSLRVTDTLTTVDSTLVIPIVVKSLHSSSTITETACKNYLAPDGQSYTTSGIKSAIIANAAGCDSTISINLTVNHVDVSVTQNSTQLAANVAGASYQWLDCNNAYSPIPGETNQSFSANQNGNYALEITQNSCVDTTACYAVTSIGIEEQKFNKNILVYPNPTQGIIKIDLGAVMKAGKLIVHDVNGKLIKEFNYKDAQQLEIDLQAQPGIYLLKIEGQVVKVLVK